MTDTSTYIAKQFLLEHDVEFYDDVTSQQTWEKAVKLGNLEQAGFIRFKDDSALILEPQSGAIVAWPPGTAKPDKGLFDFFQEKLNKLLSKETPVKEKPSTSVIRKNAIK